MSPSRLLQQYSSKSKALTYLCFFAVELAVTASLESYNAGNWIELKQIIAKKLAQLEKYEVSDVVKQSKSMKLLVWGLLGICP